MSDAERRSILSQVAEGTLSPEEAAERLSSLDQSSPQDRSGGSGSPSQTATGGDRGLPPGAPAARIRIVGSVRLIEITGDPNVKEAVAEGPHDARREGDLLIIEGEGPEVAWSQPGWRWNWSWGDGDDETEDRDREPVGSSRDFRGRSRRRVRVSGFPGSFPGGFPSGFPAGFAEAFSGGRGRAGSGSRRTPALKVRVNPNLPLEIGIKAGAMSVKGVSAPITAEADAASLQVKGFSAPLDVRVNAGKFEATGRLDEGDSRIECNAGKVDLRLDPGSSVRVTARAELSRVNLPGAETRAGGLLGSEHEATIGDGAGTLAMEVNVGSATVVVNEQNL
ncbi:MAG: hypothetical protein KY395_03825 [Actinobacteria bacterium]|nr:hypothetical protein [Actinomycetota bacterium]